MAGDGGTAGGAGAAAAAGVDVSHGPALARHRRLAVLLVALVPLLALLAAFCSSEALLDAADDVVDVGIDPRRVALGASRALALRAQLVPPRLPAVLVQRRAALRSGRALSAQGSDAEAHSGAGGRVGAEGAAPLQSGGMVFFRAYTGKRLTVQNTTVHAKWGQTGTWQKFVVERRAGAGPLASGDAVFLTAHTGNRITVGDGSTIGMTVVHARWNHKGLWQTFIVEKDGGGQVFPGDSIFLKAWTGKRITVGTTTDNTLVHARWNDRGTWQRLVVESGEPVSEQPGNGNGAGGVPAGCPYAVTRPLCLPPESQEWLITSSCTLASGTYLYNRILISGGAVVVVQQGARIGLELSGGLFVGNRSELWIGCEGLPFTGKMTTTFTGTFDMRSNTNSAGFDVRYRDAGLPDFNEFWANGLLVGHGGRIECHGVAKTSWTRLRANAAAGASVLEVAGVPKGWQLGDELVVTSTSSSPAESERVAVAAVAGNIVTLAAPLAYSHIGSWTGRGARLNAEVGVLSHNIVFTSRVNSEACAADLQNPSDAAKRSCYGGHMGFLARSVVKIDNTEFDRMGQGMVMGRYALHFHLVGDATGSYLRDNSVHRGLNRCVTLHGVFGALVQGNVCFETHGHNIYFEDGIEAGNQIIDNLVVTPKTSATICSDFHDIDWAGNRPSVSGLWITNPNNTFAGNTVVGAQYGAWFSFPTNAKGTPYSSERGTYGGVFGASKRYFADAASGYGPTSWVMRQEQARTPTIFKNNTIKGSQRNGIFVDGLVTDSEDPVIPCLSGAGYQEPGECATCPGTANTFHWAPCAFDVGVEPGLRSYRPVANEFEDIVVAYGARGVDDFSGVGSSVWASGGALRFTRAIFAFNGLGASLDNRDVDWCAAHFALGLGGYSAVWKDSVFLGDGTQVALKIYDGGFLLQNSRWAGLSYLATTRSVSDGNTNGVQLTSSAPLGWFATDATDDHFAWAMSSGQVALQPRTSAIPNLADWSAERLVGKWQTKHLHIVTTNGFGDQLKFGFREFVYGDRNSNEGWGPGVRVETGAPMCRMWLQCGFTVWCGTDVDCSPGFSCRDFLPR